MQKIPEDKIHVTGFGPFRGFATSNPSWDAVSQLPDYIEHNGQSIEIIKHEIPVTYYDVDKKWHEIWSTKPRVINFWFANLTVNWTFLIFIQLVVHCGVHKRADKICLEQNAFNGNFSDSDFSGNKLGCSNVTLQNAGGECKKLCTSFDLNNIISETNATKIKRSEHPGE